MLTDTLRPTRLADMVGQKACKTLAMLWKIQNLYASYLFHGPPGTGKTTAARIMAKLLTNLPQGMSTDETLDIMEINSASNRGIDFIRDLEQKIRLRPFIGPKKVYIFDEAHMLTREAWNAMLKHLEEPPPHVHWILCSTEPDDIPRSIQSRCLRLAFHPVQDDVMRTFLEKVSEDHKLSKGMIPDIIDQAKGSVRDALVLLESGSCEKTPKGGFNMDVILFGDRSAAIEAVDLMKQAYGESAARSSLLESCYEEMKRSSRCDYLASLLEDGTSIRLAISKTRRIS